mgnify:CR=1 FL=1
MNKKIKFKIFLLYRIILIIFVAKNIFMKKTRKKSTKKASKKICYTRKPASKRKKSKSQRIVAKSITIKINK